MALPRELNITTDGVYQIVENSPYGRESVAVAPSAGGSWGGSNISIQYQMVFNDGTMSELTTVPVNGDFIDSFIVEFACGRKSNVFLEVTNTTATTNLMAKSTPIS